MSLVRKQFSIGETSSFECWIYVIRGVDGRPDEFWFKGNDVAELLEYARPHKAIADHVDEVWRRNWSVLRGTADQDHLSNTRDPHVTSPQDDVTTPPNWQPHTVFISEPGLYALVTRSKKPEAVKFTKWIYEDVLPSLRRTGTFTVGGEPMDTTPTAHEIAMLKKDLELQKMKNMVQEKDAEVQRKDAQVRERESAVRETRLMMEKKQLELHYRYAFQTENAQQLGRAAVEQYARRQAESKRYELMKSFVSNKYRIMRNMDDVDPGKVNNIGVVYNRSKDEYQIVRQQWSTTLKSYDFIQRDARSAVEQLDAATSNKRYLCANLVVQGEMIAVAHGVNVWNAYIKRTADAPHLFGLMFSDLSMARFRILDDADLRKHYEFYATDDGTPDVQRRYTNKLYRFYRRLFDDLRFADVEDCVSRCRSPDIWSVREHLRAFVEANDINSLETLSHADMEPFDLNDAVSDLVTSSIGELDGNALNAMADAFPKEAETLTWRKVCERQRIVPPSPSTGAIQYMAIEMAAAAAAAAAQSTDGGCTEFREPTPYTVQIPNTPQRPGAEEIADTVSVMSSLPDDDDDSQQHMSRYFKDLSEKRQSAVDKYTK